MSTSEDDYTYKYDYRINTFPEEVYLHEFLHTLERNSAEYNYSVPALHSNAQYGYEEEDLIGLKNWYKDYMNCSILDKSTNTYIGLNENIYKYKPPHESDFDFPLEVKFNEEPTNIIQEIRALLKVVKDLFD